MKNDVLTDTCTARDIYLNILAKLNKSQRAVLSCELLGYGNEFSYQEIFKIVLDISKNKEVISLAEKGLSLYYESFMLENDV